MTPERIAAGLTAAQRGLVLALSGDQFKDWLAKGVPGNLGSRRRIAALTETPSGGPGYIRRLNACGLEVQAILIAEEWGVTNRGDAFCRDCNQPNSVWYAPHQLWNYVMGGPEAKDDPGGVLCQDCFMERVRKLITVLPHAILTADSAFAQAALEQEQPK